MTVPAGTPAGIFVHLPVDPPVSTAPGRGGSKPPAAAQPLNIQRTAQLRQLREAKSLPYMAWAYKLPYHPLQNVYSCNRLGHCFATLAKYIGGVI